MERKLKSILLLVLVAVLAVVVFVPPQTQADPYQMPGQMGGGIYGRTCWCPLPNQNCGCGIIDPIPY